MRFETRAIHDGQAPDPLTGAVTVPVYQTSTYQQEAIGRPQGGFEYSRTGNPTRQALEQALASLEERRSRAGLRLRAGRHHRGAAAAAAGRPRAWPATTSTAAPTACWSRSSPLGAARLDYADGRRSRALSPRRMRPEHPADLDRDARPTRCCNSPTSRRLAGDRTRAQGPCWWWTTPSPAPISSGRWSSGPHVVVHSTTKYLGGHSDVIGGAVVTSLPEAARASSKFYQNAAGAVPGPWDCWLVLRGLKTLARADARARAQCPAPGASSWRRIRRWSGCYYPGLASHPQHALAARQMSGFGGMISVELKGGCGRRWSVRGRAPEALHPGARAWAAWSRWSATRRR